VSNNLRLFLEQVVSGCTSGKPSEWNQYRSAAKWALDKIDAQEDRINSSMELNKVLHKEIADACDEVVKLNARIDSALKLCRRSVYTAPMSFAVRLEEVEAVLQGPAPSPEKKYITPNDLFILDPNLYECLCGWKGNDLKIGSHPVITGDNVPQCPKCGRYIGQE
jgi:ElaB/YqjD/DUF883 family membrane-anchored ribosome-binding protein